MCFLACESFVFLPVRLGELRECFHNSIMVIISCANTDTHMDKGPGMSLNPMSPSEHTVMALSILTKDYKGAVN